MRTIFWLVLLGVSPAYTQVSRTPTTGNQFLPYCAAAVRMMDEGVSKLSTADVIKGTACADYVAGFMDGFVGAQSAAKGRKVLCFPPNFDYGQAVRVFEKWMRDHPEQLHHSRAGCLAMALAEHFRCVPTNE